MMMHHHESVLYRNIVVLSSRSWSQAHNYQNKTISTVFRNTGQQTLFDGVLSEVKKTTTTKLDCSVRSQGQSDGSKLNLIAPICSAPLISFATCNHTQCVNVFYY